MTPGTATGAENSEVPSGIAVAVAVMNPPAGNGKGPVRTTVTYDVKLNGHTHKVTVSPAA